MQIGEEGGSCKGYTYLHVMTVASLINEGATFDLQFDFVR